MRSSKQQPKNTNPHALKMQILGQEVEEKNDPESRTLATLLRASERERKQIPSSGHGRVQNPNLRLRENPYKS